jgi:hypothetical protein
LEISRLVLVSLLATHGKTDHLAVFDIEKIAKSIVGFSDYFSLRIVLLLLSSYIAYRYAWSPDYYGLASRAHYDLTTAINSFSNDKVLGLFKLEVIVPLLFLFVLISLLDIHMKVLAFVSRLFPLRFSLIFRGDFALAVNEPAIFREWRKVSGVYGYYKYRELVIRGFHDDLDPQLRSSTFGTIGSLIHYLKAYGLILFTAAIFFPSIFVGHARWQVFGTAFMLMLVSVLAGLTQQLFHHIKRDQVVADKLREYVYKYNDLKQIRRIEKPEQVDLISPPQDSKSTLELFETFVPSIRVYFVLPILALEYDLKPLWIRVRDRAFKHRITPARR